MELKITVPASTANLGPGFDAFGMALGLYDVVEIRTTKGSNSDSDPDSNPGLTVEIVNAGAGECREVPTDGRHLVVRALHRACAHWNIPVPGLFLRCHNAIPHSRGLGSSASAVVTGIAAGYALAGRELDHGALQLAAEFEGHADNAAASFFGGLIITWSEQGEFFYQRLNPHTALRATVAIPSVRSSTAATRKLLPESVPHVDAAFTAGRAALAVSALTTSPELLFPATEDRLHQSYRAPAMPVSAKLVQALRERGIAAAISGAGPTVLVLTTDGVVPEGIDFTGFTVRELPIDSRGVQVEVG